MACENDCPYFGNCPNTLAAQITFATFIGIAWYNALELIVLIFVSFSRYKGLYFWSLFLSGTFGVLPYSVGFLIKIFDLMSTPYLNLVLLSVGWWIMITGQAFVLYSRLHLVLRDQKTLHRVLAMIIIDAFVLHVPTTVLTIGANTIDCGNPSFGHWKMGYKVIEKLQMTGFCLQEFILSSLYIWETVKMLRLSPEKGSRKIMYQLLSINCIFIMMDVGLLTIAYADLYEYETTFKGAIYSIKLKLEFAVLGKLVHLVNSHSWSPEYAMGPSGFPDFVDASRVTTDVTRAPECPKGPPRPPWSHPEEGSNESAMPTCEHSEGKGTPKSDHANSFVNSQRLDLTTANIPLELLQQQNRNSKPDYAEWPS